MFDRAKDLVEEKLGLLASAVGAPGSDRAAEERAARELEQRNERARARRVATRSSIDRIYAWRASRARVPYLPFGAIRLAVHGSMDPIDPTCARRAARARVAATPWP